MADEQIACLAPDFDEGEFATEKNADLFRNLTRSDRLLPFVCYSWSDKGGKWWLTG